MKTLILMALLGLMRTAQAHAQSAWPLWDHYQSYFIQKNGRVVDYDRDNLTTSEGQGYAMFFALVANDRPGFDRLYHWTTQNLAAGNLRTDLPAWSWGRRPDGTLGVKDPNSASDADLWIAYDLLQAGRLWKQQEYVTAGNDLLKQIASREVSHLFSFPVLLPAHSGFEHDGSITLNTSYMPLFLIQAAAYAQPQGPWKAMAASLPALIHRTTIRGFASDWTKLEADGQIHPSAPLDSSSDQATGSYDAIRVYLWAGITSSSTPGRDAILSTLSPMASYMKTHSLPPEFVIEGQPSVRGTGPISFSAALIPFLQSTQQPNAAAQQQDRLKSAWSTQFNLYGNPPRYYDQNLAMFTLGFTEHKYRIQNNGEVEVSWRR
ncbi:cellulase [Edaphobacter sp. HDX4]|uniref:cellulose synthase complex periplasmic endoglucanase BcsZ n=1 Tax=Edaphobacter sp. HDX4 TaxID=2794064 RepID=UPI002FE6B045